MCLPVRNPAMDALLLLVARWLERVYLATGFPGSKANALSKSVTLPLRCAISSTVFTLSNSQGQIWLILRSRVLLEKLIVAHLISKLHNLLWNTKDYCRVHKRPPMTLYRKPGRFSPRPDIFCKPHSNMSQLRRFSDGLRAGRPGFCFRWENEGFLFLTVSWTALGHTHPPIQLALQPCMPMNVTQAWFPKAVNALHPGRLFRSGSSL
jgi:hypothetical protein